MNALEFTDVVKVYDSGHRALDGLTFQVPAGSVFGFLGLNGAGKTTTIRIVAGLLTHEAGSVVLLGKDLRDRTRASKRELGFVLDEPMYFEWMSPVEYLHFAATMYGLHAADAHTRVEELLDFFDLSGKASDTIATFSTGMKKKVSLASAIIHDPKIIMLDEPLDGLDPIAARDIKETLTLMASRGTTIFITSHVLDTVERLCSDVAIVHQGRMLLYGSPETIRQQARTLSGGTFASLEELFVEVVGGSLHRKQLSWL